MDRRTRNLFALALLVVLAVTGGAALILGGMGSGPTGVDGLPSVTGVVVGVDSRGLADVRTFTLRTNDGRTLVFGLASLENGTAFPPGHLAEHQATASPIQVWYRDVDGTHQAVRLLDAP